MRSMACLITGNAGAVSLLRSAGRRNGTSTPMPRAITAISVIVRRHDNPVDPTRAERRLDRPGDQRLAAQGRDVLARNALGATARRNDPQDSAVRHGPLSFRRSRTLVIASKMPDRRQRSARSTPRPAAPGCCARSACPAVAIAMFDRPCSRARPRSARRWFPTCLMPPRRHHGRDVLHVVAPRRTVVVWHAFVLERECDRRRIERHASRLIVPADATTTSA